MDKVQWDLWAESSVLNTGIQTWRAAIEYLFPMLQVPAYSILLSKVGIEWQGLSQTGREIGSFKRWLTSITSPLALGEMLSQREGKSYGCGLKEYNSTCNAAAYVCLHWYFKFAMRRPMTESKLLNIFLPPKKLLHMLSWQIRHTGISTFKLNKAPCFTPHSLL